MHRVDGHRGQSADGHKGHSTDGHRGQAFSLVKDRLLVAANAALASLAGNADTHFAMVNEGAAPALVAALQHGTFPLCMPAFRLHIASLMLHHWYKGYKLVNDSPWSSVCLSKKYLRYMHRYCALVSSLR